MVPSCISGELASFAHRLADASGRVIRPYFRQRLDVTDKSKGASAFDPVTVADQQAEAAIRALIKAEHPDHGILGEELGAEAGSSPYTWVVDPIDGTRAFICGIPLWGTLIALNDGERPILGILDQPVTSERFLGDGESAELLHEGVSRPLRTRPCQALSEAVLTTTHPTGYFTPVEQKAFQEVGQRARMTRYGGDCYAYGLLAMGFIDVIIEATLKPYDVQALIPIVQGAGGIMTTWKGGDAQHGGRIVAAGDRRVYEEVLETLRSCPE